MERATDIQELRALQAQVASTFPITMSPLAQLSNKLANASLYMTPNQMRYVERAQTPAFHPTSNNVPNYVPPHRRDILQTPSTTPQQLPTPMQTTNTFRDNGTNHQQDHSLPTFYNVPNTPSPLKRREDKSLSLAFLAQQNSRLYVDDQEGHQNYERDIRAWESVYGATTQMSFNCEHLPLHPGGTVLGSQECYGCGRAGHMASNMVCQLTEEERTTP